jgi:hypothetical protein
MAGYSQLHYYTAFDTQRPFIARKKFSFNGKTFVRNDDFPTDDIPAAKLKRLWQARLIAYNEDLMVEVKEAEANAPTNVVQETEVPSTVDETPSQDNTTEPTAEKNVELDVVIASKPPWFKIIKRGGYWVNDNEYGKPTRSRPEIFQMYKDLTGHDPEDF